MGQMIRLYSGNTQPTRLPTTTACHPFSAVATYGQVVPGASWVMRPYVRPFPSRMLTLPPSETMTTVPETGGFSTSGGSGCTGRLSFPHPLRRPSARHGFFLRTCRPPPAPRRPERRGVPPRFPRRNSRPRRSGEARTPTTKAAPAGRARRFLPSRLAADGCPAGFPRASHRPCFPARSRRHSRGRADGTSSSSRARRPSF